MFWDGGDAAGYDNGAVDGGSGVWSGPARSWTDASGAVNGDMRPDPGFAVFRAAAGTVTVSGPDIAVTGMQFAVDGYQLAGDGIELTATETILRVGDGTAAGADMSATLAASLTGAGALVKTDLGTLILTGANSYVGGTIVRGGTLIGDTASIRGDLVNDATLVFDQDFDGLFGGVISGAGSIVKDGAGVLTLTQANEQDWSIAGGVLGVGAAALTGDVSIAAGAGLGFAATADTVWDGLLSGAGAFAVPGAATLTLTGASSGFSGVTTVTGGGLRVNGVLGGDVTVAGGALGGTRALLGAVSLGAGRLTGVQGQTLTLGALALSADSSVDVTLGTASADSLFDVTGDLTLDGTLNVTDLGGFGVGVYRLFDYGGVLTDNGLAAGATPTGVTAGDLFVQTAVAGRINLINTAGVALRFWDGGASPDDGVLQGGAGTWSLAGRGWTGAGGAVNGAYDNSGFAVFAGTGGTVAVDGVGIGVTGLRFAVDGYAITGAAVELTGAETLIRVGDGTAAGAGMTATIASSLTGAGGLVKTDLGTLILTGTNSYGGGTLVRGGILVGNATSIAGDILNDATLVFDQAADADFAGAISGDGLTVKRGAGALSLLGANAMDWSVETGGLTAQAGAFDGDVAVASGAFFRLDAAADAVWSGVLSGQGLFEKAGAGALTLTGDASAFAGETFVSAGLLVLNGALGGELRLADGAMLGGSGAIGQLTAGEGAVVAPGNSIGTLNVTGDVVFNPGSVYEVEVDPATDVSDHIVAGGMAILNGGVVRHIGLTGEYRPSSTYTILTAAGGVTGAFDAIETDFAFLGASLDYEPTAVLMTLERNAVPFPAVGETVNQRAAAAAVEATQSGAPLYDAVVGLNAGDARLAFDMLSGELHGSISAAQSEVAQVLAGTLSGRMDEGRGLDTGAALWARATGSRSRLATDGNAASLSHGEAGLMMGADAGLGSDFRLGLAAGASAHDYDSPARAGAAEGESYSLAVYGSGQWGPLALKGAVSSTWHEVETERLVAFPGFTERLEADHDAETVHAFIEASWRVAIGPGTALEPFITLARVRTQSDAFTETGGAAALAVERRVQSAALATVGLGLSRAFDQGEGRTARLSGRLGWRHASDDLVGDGRHAFAASPSAGAFTVHGLPMAEDAMVGELGLDLTCRTA